MSQENLKILGKTGTL